MSACCGNGMGGGGELARIMLFVLRINRHLPSVHAAELDEQWSQLREKINKTEPSHRNKQKKAEHRTIKMIYK